MYCDAFGTIEDPNGTIVITQIFVKIFVRVPAGTRPAAERAIAVFERGCPVHQTLKNCIDIAIETEVTEEDATLEAASAAR